jgi:hypothetical protein
MIGVLDIFGLQVLLEDKTSENAKRVEESLRRMGVAVQDVEKSVYGSFQRMESIMHSGFQIQQWGQTIRDIGTGIEKIFAKIGIGVAKTSSEFEKHRIRLEGLYNDAKKGEEVFNWAVNQALLTPFTTEDYVKAVANFKGSGLDPQALFKNWRTGAMQDLTMFAGDLAAGTGKRMEDAFFSLKEAIAGNDWTSLKRRFDGITKDMVEAVTGMEIATGGTEEDIRKRAEALTKFISLRYGGMMLKLGASFEGLMSRTKENLMIFAKDIGDAGFFPFLKKEIDKLISFIEGNREKLKAFAKVVSDSLIAIATPLSKLVEYGQKLSLWFAEFSTAHPKIAKFITTISVAIGGLLSLSGVVIMLSGSFVTMVASLATLALNMRMTHSNTKLSALLFQGFGKIVLQGALAMSKLTVATFVLSSAWNKNIGGMKTAILGLGDNIRHSYEQFQRLTSLPLGTFLVYLRNGAVYTKEGKDAITDLTKTFLKFYYVLNGFFDYLDDGKVLEDTIYRLRELGALGWLEALIKAEVAIRSIAEGIATGFANIIDVLRPPFEWLYNRLKDILNLIDSIFGTSSSQFLTDVSSPFTGKFSSTGWQKIGELIGVFIAAGVTMRLAGFFRNQIKKIQDINDKAKKALVASKGLEVNQAGQMLTNIPFERNVNGSWRRAHSPQYRKVTWKNIILDDMGKKLDKLDKMRERNAARRTLGWEILKRENKELQKQIQLTKKASQGRGTLGRIITAPFSFFGANFLDKMKVLTSAVVKTAKGQKLSTKMSKGGVWTEKGAMDALKRFFSRPFTATKSFVQKVPTTLKNITPQATKQTLVQKFGDLIATVIGAVFGSRLGQAILQYGRRFLVSPVIRVFTWLAPALAPIIAHPIVAAISAVGALLVGVFADVGIAKKIYNWIIEGIQWGLAGIYVFFEVVWKLLVKLAKSIKELFLNAFKPIGDFFNDLSFAIDALLVGDFKAFQERFSQAWNKFTDPATWKRGMENITKPWDDFFVRTQAKIKNIHDLLGMETDIAWIRQIEAFEARQRQVNAIANPVVLGTYLQNPVITSPTQPALLSLPHHKTGLDRVPYDGYTAVLHDEEAVLNAKDAAVWRANKYGGGMIGRSTTSTTTRVENNFNIERIELSLPSVREATPDQIAAAMEDPTVITALQRAIAKAERLEALRQRMQPSPTWG